MTPAIIEFLTSLTQSRVILLLLINLFLFIIGMVMDAVTGIILVVPLFFPLATGVLGLNPVHFGAMVVTNLAVGMITPPMAGNLFVAMRLTGASLAESIKDIIPFVLIGMIVVMVVTFIPGFSMGLLDILK